MRRKFYHLPSCLIVLAILLLPISSQAEVIITLKNSFIEDYKNKATISATYTVVKAHKKPNAPSNDGDLHIAGRAPEIELNTVAEIMNAASEKQSVDLIHSMEGTGNPIKLTGAWRIWCEHGGNSDQIQGGTLEDITNTNPDHVFEIHPVTKINDNQIYNSLRPIKGFDPKEAHEAFVKYENIRCKIKPNTDTTSIFTTMAGYNYVEFIMEITGDQKEVEDGRMVFASVCDLEGELLVRKRRMVFIKDTPPEKAVKKLKNGDKFHVLGLPRIDLALVSWRSKNKDTNPDVLNWNLPYEIIVVGVYKD